MSFFDGIFDWLKEALIGFIETLAESFETLGQEIADPLSQHAGEYSSSALNLVTNIAENVVLPVAAVLFTYIMVNDLIEMLIAQNNMHERTTEDLYKWIFKCAIGILLISNSFTIANAFIELGAWMVDQAVPYSNMAEITMDTFEASASLMELEWTQLFLIAFSMMITWLITQIGMLFINLFIIARFFEIYMLLSMAPIPFSTLMSGQLNQVGIGYMKNLLSLAIQAVIILLCFGIYVAISATYTIDAVVDGNWSFIGAGAQGFVLIIVLVVMVWRSRSISKDVVGI